ncbi:MAG: hypothetical protein EU541_01200 [Promethearchaeota archaeon]|nr:MAG: hypothetical protein EU541_01200 [Candidatus Lokiarchaeota archaeon]
MANKTISLPEDVYSALKKEKRKGETFPELISRLLKEREKRMEHLESVAGSLKNDDEWDSILKKIYEDREKPARI